MPSAERPRVRGRVAAHRGGRRRTLESAFPAPLLPRVSLVSYKGNLGMDSGPPQSV